MRSGALLLLVGLGLHSGGQAAFIVPDPPPEAQTEFAWWDGFSEGYTDYGLPAAGETVLSLPGADEGNEVNRIEADNTDAKLYQTGTDTAFITSTQGIYSFAEPLEFMIHDQPGFEADSVLLQTSSLGALPDLDSARLFYRETEDGILFEADSPVGDGFLQDGSDAFAMWEWDLSAETVFDYFVLFDSVGTAMSLQEVQLDTFDRQTDLLGVALITETNSNFITVGTVGHNRVGENAPSPSYEEGDTVEVRAVPEDGAGHVFVGWEGAVTGSDPSASFVLSGEPRVRAIFAPHDYDSWKFNQINPFVTDPPASERDDLDANPDGDAFDNLMEYALGGLPELRDSDAIRPRLHFHAADGTARFTYRRQMAATDLEYRVEVSGDLENWNHNGDGSGLTHTEEVGEPVFNGDGTETVTVRATQPPPPGGKRFFRLTVIRNTP